MNDELESPWGITSDQSTFSKAVEAALSGAGETGKLDDRIAGLGLPQLLLAEKHGGLAGSLLDAVLAVEQAGRFLVGAERMVSWILAGIALNSCPESAASPVGEALRAGRTVDLVFGHDTGAGLEVEARMVACEARTVLPLRGSGPAIVVCGPVGSQSITFLPVVPIWSSHAETTMDPSRPMTVVNASWSSDDSCAVIDGADAARVIRRLTTAMRLCWAADSIGTAQACLEMSISHVTGRQQFGQPIGSFQAVKHRIVNDHMRISLARHLLWNAARSYAQENGDDVELLTLAAGIKARESLAETSKSAVQLLGGLGFTIEGAASKYLMRSRVNARLMSSHGEDLRDVATLVQNGADLEWL